MLGDILHNLIAALRFTPGEPMLFSSGTFWMLFLLFLPIYSLLSRHRWQMIAFVVAFSLYFYYKSSGLFVVLLLCTSIIDWLLSRAIVKTDSRSLRRFYVGISLGASLGILGYFKYANFFLWNINAMVGSNFQPLDLILPVGISFYTFQSVSYIIDVYKGRVKPTSTWLEYAFFLSFFPALVAGPIVRADYFLPQIERPHRALRRECWLGMWMIILGIIKKAIIADYIAQYNDLIFQSPGTSSGFETLMGVIGYTMQIYCDFSGYSDMAIGLAMIMGFRLAQNFNFPYKSQNLTDFWRRWHISLSTWLRDYIYIPLGGNRRGTLRTYINNLATMLIGGLWHGAAWKFVFWGGMHGLGLAIHKATKPITARLGTSWPVKAVSWAITFTFVAALWVYFRADSWLDAGIIIRQIFCDFSIAYALPFIQARRTWVILMAVIILAHSLPTATWRRLATRFITAPWLVKLIIFVVVVQLVIELRSESVTPFIYFQF
jgi:D-alanyl-lipoteichoic acid acyltransferase DltB (MBOAT superfamily)